MKRNIQLSNEIENLRAEVNNFVSKYGLTGCDTLLELSKKLDLAIVRWFKDSKGQTMRNIYSHDV